jgi:exosortase
MKQSTRMAEFEGKMPQEIRQGAPTALAVELKAWRWPLYAAAMLLAMFVILFWGFLRSQVIRAVSQQADWGHTLVVPFIVGYFVYLNRKKLLAEPFRTAWFGLVPMLAGMGIYVISTTVPTLNHFNIQGTGVWLTLVGLVLLFFGWRSMTWLWFPLLYLFVFGQNISERLMDLVTFPMQDITARGAAALLGIGLDVDREGNTITIFHHGEPKPLNIAQACSGMRMLMAFSALGVAMAYTGFTRFWQRAALVLMAVPTAIAVNILRVVTLGILSLLDVGFAAGDFHSFIGLVWLVPAFMIYLGLMWCIRHSVIEERRPVAVRA